MLHTPGPWEVRQRDHVGDNVFSAENKRIANTFGPEDMPEFEANARLIAAAPDLLAFAKACEAWEAEFILDSECWPINDSGLPVFNESINDKFLELQKLRNEVVKKATAK